MNKYLHSSAIVPISCEEYYKNKELYDKCYDNAILQCIHDIPKSITLSLCFCILFFFFLIISDKIEDIPIGGVSNTELKKENNHKHRYDADNCTQNNWEK